MTIEFWKLSNSYTLLRRTATQKLLFSLKMGQKFLTHDFRAHVYLACRNIFWREKYEKHALTRELFLRVGKHHTLCSPFAKGSGGKCTFRLVPVYSLALVTLEVIPRRPALSHPVQKILTAASSWHWWLSWEYSRLHLCDNGSVCDHECMLLCAPASLIRN